MVVSSLPFDHSERLARVQVALDGLSVGDAFGERFFSPAGSMMLAQRGLPAPPWGYTDDTVMALGIVEVLRKHGRIEQDELAQVFARRYRQNPCRGYGATAHQILAAISQGDSWQNASRSAFGGQGSMGNGGAMRSAPVGAYYADDFQKVIAQARASAEVTHAHMEGIAGAVAVAIAAAWAWQKKIGHPRAELLETVLEWLPPGGTYAGVEKALDLTQKYPDLPPGEAAAILGNGSRIIAQDTVPFALWCAAKYLASFPEALWATISAWGDIDTNCAIVGGIVALYTGSEAIPQQWLEAREKLD